MNKIVDTVLMIIIIATMLPIALQILMDVDTAGWGSEFTGLTTMWNLLPLLGVVCVVILLFRRVTGRERD